MNPNPLKEIEALLSTIPHAQCRPEDDEEQIFFFNGVVRWWPLYQEAPLEVYARTFDDMLEKTLVLVQNLVVIPGARFRSMSISIGEPYDNPPEPRRITHIRVRSFLPKNDYWHYYSKLIALYKGE